MAHFSPVLEWFTEFAHHNEGGQNAGRTNRDSAAVHRLRSRAEFVDAGDAALAAVKVAAGLRWMALARPKFRAWLHLFLVKIIRIQKCFRSFLRRRDNKIAQVLQNWVSQEDTQKKAVRAQLAKEIRLNPERVHSLVSDYTKLFNRDDDMHRAVLAVYDERRRRYRDELHECMSRTRVLRAELAEVLPLLARTSPVDPNYLLHKRRKTQAEAELADLRAREPVLLFTVVSVPPEDLSSALAKVRHASVVGTLPPLLKISQYVSPSAQGLSDGGGSSSSEFCDLSRRSSVMFSSPSRGCISPPSPTSASSSTAIPPLEFPARPCLPSHQKTAPAPFCRELSTCFSLPPTPRMEECGSSVARSPEDRTRNHPSLLSAHNGSSGSLLSEVGPRRSLESREGSPESEFFPRSPEVSHTPTNAIACSPKLKAALRFARDLSSIGREDDPGQKPALSRRPHDPLSVAPASTSRPGFGESVSSQFRSGSMKPLRSARRSGAVRAVASPTCSSALVEKDMSPTDGPHRLQRLKKIEATMSYPSLENPALSLQNLHRVSSTASELSKCHSAGALPQSEPFCGVVPPAISPSASPSFRSSRPDTTSSAGFNLEAGDAFPVGVQSSRTEGPFGLSSGNPAEIGGPSVSLADDRPPARCVSPLGRLSLTSPSGRGSSSTTRAAPLASLASSPLRQRSRSVAHCPTGLSAGCTPASSFARARSHRISPDGCTERASNPFHVS